MNKKSFGKSLKHFRTEKNMTQAELAERIHVSQQTVSGWEQGRTYPDLESVTTICDELGISEYDVFDKCKYIEAEEEKSSVAKTVAGIVIALSVTILVVTLTINVLARGVKKENPGQDVATSDTANKEDDIQEELVSTAIQMEEANPVFEMITEYDKPDEKLLMGDSVVVSTNHKADLKMKTCGLIYDYKLTSGENILKDFINKKTDELTINYVYTKTGKCIIKKTIKRTIDGKYTVEGEGLGHEGYYTYINTADGKKVPIASECIKIARNGDKTLFFICDEGDGKLSLTSPYYSSKLLNVYWLFVIED